MENETMVILFIILSGMANDKLESLQNGKTDILYPANEIEKVR